MWQVRFNSHRTEVFRIGGSCCVSGVSSAPATAHIHIRLFTRYPDVVFSIPIVVDINASFVKLWICMYKIPLSTAKSTTWKRTSYGKQEQVMGMRRGKYQFVKTRRMSA